jgi:hypothetical protein
VQPQAAAAHAPELRQRLLQRGLWLEYLTLAWNVVGVVILAIAALAANSVALAGFSLDSLIEIVASIVVVWQLTDVGGEGERAAMRVIGARSSRWRSTSLRRPSICSQLAAVPAHPRSASPGRR